MFEEEFEQEQQVNLSDYLRILYRGRWFIIASFILVMMVTVFITFTTPPVYEAHSTVLIESTGAMERSIFEMNYFGNQSTLITNQMEILKSRTLAERVIRRLDLSDLRDSLSVFQPNEEGEVRSLRGMAGWMQENLEATHRKDTDIIEVKFAANSAFEAAFILNVITEEFKQFNEETNRFEVTDLRKFIERQIEKKGEELRLAEENLRSFQEQEKMSSLDGETAQMVNRLAEAESMMEAAQVELDAFQERKQSLIGQIDERKTSLARDLSEISTPYLVSMQDELAKAVAERTKFVIAIESDVSNPNKIAYQSQLKAYDEKITGLRNKLEEESNKIKTSSMVKDPFALSQELISSLLTVESEIKSLTAKISALQSVVGEYEIKLESLPLKVLELARLERRRKVQEETFMMMYAKLEETRIKEAGQSGNVRIVDEGIEPLVPVKPNKRMNLMLGALIGLGLGIGISFLIDYFDNSIKSIREVEKLGLNFLAAIPKIEQEKLEKKIAARWEQFEDEGSRIESRLITHFDPKSPVSEAYRTLRTNIQFSNVEKKIRTILITSSGPKEGKSTTIANLAITLAQMGQRTVLIDTDLRRPVVHSIFGMEKDDGLTNYMMGQTPYEEVMKKTFHENLFVIPSGVLPPNPSELLGSQKMEDFIERLKQDFDMILFDSPPVIAVTDAAIMSTKIDGTLMVISAGHTNREAAQRAKALLENVKAPVLGVILNNVNVDGTYGSSYYYYYYHYYYGSGSGKGKRKRKRGY